MAEEIRATLPLVDKKSIFTHGRVKSTSLVMQSLQILSFQINGGLTVRILRE